MSDTFRIQPLGVEHHRTGFVCGSDPLDRYFRTQASQDVRRRIAVCFVAVSRENDEIAGYYTLSATGVVLEALSAHTIKKLARYPVVPAVLLGRLAVARSYQGFGLGGALVADALKRVGRATDAKDEAAQRF